MTVAENHERGHYVESPTCDRWPLEQFQAIAETVSTRAVSVDLEPSVSVRRTEKWTDGEELRHGRDTGDAGLGWAIGPTSA